MNDAENLSKLLTHLPPAIFHGFMTIEFGLEMAALDPKQGKREQAYQSSLEATAVAPDEPLAWYLRSKNAPSNEERLMCLSRAYSLKPDDPEVKAELRSSVHILLKQEPFLAYVYETEQFYQVRSGRELLINIPKDRIFEIPYLKKKPGFAQPAFRWLTLSLDRAFLGDQVADVTVRSEDLVVLAQVLLDGLRLGGPFDDDEMFGHSSI